VRGGNPTFRREGRKKKEGRTGGEEGNNAYQFFSGERE